jgi:hypothetical protein
MVCMFDLVLNKKHKNIIKKKNKRHNFHELYIYRTIYMCLIFVNFLLLSIKGDNIYIEKVAGMVDGSSIATRTY